MKIQVIAKVSVELPDGLSEEDVKEFLAEAEHESIEGMFDLAVDSQQDFIDKGFEFIKSARILEVDAEASVLS